MSGGDMETRVAEGIRLGRAFLKSDFAEMDEKFQSDQQKRLPQPPLANAPCGEGMIPLRTDFADMLEGVSFFNVLDKRRSRRTFAKEAMSLDQLAFALWSAQGVQQVRGDNYATLRPAPSGGARHPFEVYLMIANVAGLEPGAYHYLPMQNALEYLWPVEDLPETLDAMLCGQAWAKGAAATFFFSAVPYRAEWRYASLAHRVVLIDLGHAMQNLYLGCEAVGCGMCAIAAYDQGRCDGIFRLDGEEEHIVYAAPAGVLRGEDA